MTLLNLRQPSPPALRPGLRWAPRMRRSSRSCWSSARSSRCPRSGRRCGAASQITRPPDHCVANRRPWPCSRCRALLLTDRSAQPSSQHNKNNNSMTKPHPRPPAGSCCSTWCAPRARSRSAARSARAARWSRSRSRPSHTLAVSACESVFGDLIAQFWAQTAIASALPHAAL